MKNFKIIGILSGAVLIGEVIIGCSGSKINENVNFDINCDIKCSTGSAIINENVEVL